MISREELETAIGLRQLIGVPPPAEEQALRELMMLLGLLEQQLLSRIKANKKMMKFNREYTRQFLQDKPMPWLKGRAITEPSTVDICVTLMMDEPVTYLFTLARKSHDEGKQAGFVGFFDYTCGVMDIAAAIHKGQAGAWEGYEAHSSDNKQLGQLLGDDPTGFKVVEQWVNWLKEEAKLVPGKGSRILAYQVPELVIAGAEFGERVYKLMYQLAQESA